MTTTLSASLKFALAAPLALALAACDKTATAGAAPEGEAVSTVAAPQGSAWSEQVVRTEQGGYLVGNPNAPIKLVEYGSLTCPACAAFSNAGAEPLMSEYVDSGRVNFELRSFLIHGTVDLVLTRLIECSGLEAVHPLSHEVWKNVGSLVDGVQAAGPQLEQAMQLPENQRFVAFAERSGLLDFFAARGVSETEARQCLADYPAMEALAKNSDSYSNDGVQGTPTFELNGTRIDANSWDGVEEALQRAGAR